MNPTLPWILMTALMAGTEARPGETAPAEGHDPESRPEGSQSARPPWYPVACEHSEAFCIEVVVAGLVEPDDEAREGIFFQGLAAVYRLPAEHPELEAWRARLIESREQGSRVRVLYDAVAVELISVEAPGGEPAAESPPERDAAEQEEDSRTEKP